MNPLILHLKYKYYQMILDGEKTVEYREYKPYWKNRIKNQKQLILVPRYNNGSDIDLNANITKIEIIPYSDLPLYAQKEFMYSAYSHYFSIKFELKSCS